MKDLLDYLPAIGLALATLLICLGSVYFLRRESNLLARVEASRQQREEEKRKLVEMLSQDWHTSAMFLARRQYYWAARRIFDAQFIIAGDVAYKMIRTIYGCALEVSAHDEARQILAMYPDAARQE